MIALVTLINRSGMMVLPFLSLYLTEDLGFSLGQSSIVMSVFGLGSMVGALTGGYLADRIGYFKVVFFSLIFGGILYLTLALLSHFYALCVGVFFASLVADALRPAMSASLTVYADKNNLTRTFSLMRMAVNLGASIGPALAGLLAVVGYFWIFIGDGITSIAAGVAYYFYFRNSQSDKKKQHPSAAQTEREDQSHSKNPLTDFLFIFYCISTLGYAIVFFQMWGTMPLFFRNIHQISEPEIGVLLALNGLFVFLFEMPLVFKLENNYRISSVINVGIILLLCAMLVLNTSEQNWILYLSIFLMSISEILAMPFMMTVVLKRATLVSRGKYIGFYTMVWGSAFIFAPLIGMYCVEYFGYQFLWYAMSLICIFTLIAVGYFTKKMLLENSLDHQLKPE